MEFEFFRRVIVETIITENFEIQSFHKQQAPFRNFQVAFCLLCYMLSIHKKKNWKKSLDAKHFHTERIKVKYLTSSLLLQIENHNRKQTIT